MPVSGVALRLSVLSLSSVVLLALLAVPATAAPWKLPLNTATPGAVFPAEHRSIKYPVVACDGQAPVALYQAGGELSVDDAVGYPGSPATTLPAGRVALANNSGERFVLVHLYSDSPPYQAELGRLCFATFPASPLASAVARGRAIPNLQLVGSVTAPVRLAIKRLAQAPAKAHASFNDHGGMGVLMARGNITTMQGWEHNAGLTCSGADSGAGGRDCDALTGLGSWQFDTPAFIARPHARDRSDTVALHEYAHAVDTSTAAPQQPRTSDLPPWRTGPAKEVLRCWNFDYERNSPSEWFATSFDLRYNSVAGSTWLRRFCPVTYRFHTDLFGNGAFDPTLPKDGRRDGELRTVTHSPVVRAASMRSFVVTSKLGERPTSARITATATYAGNVVGRSAWRTAAATSSRVLTTRGAPTGARVRICVTASNVGRGVAAIPAWCGSSAAR